MARTGKIAVAAYPSAAPDGGYGWIIMLASFAMHIVVDGLQYTFGVFYVEFLDYFADGKGKTSLVGSVMAGTCQMTAPLASALVNRFGCRRVAIVGSVIATFGFAICRVSQSINGLMVTYGVIGGFGLGLMYLPAVISVSVYFERRRAFATGVAVCGAGVGCFIFAPAGSYLLYILDWKNAVLFIAAVTAQGCVFGAFFRPLPVPKKQPTNTSNSLPADEVGIAMHLTKSPNPEDGKGETIAATTTAGTEMAETKTANDEVEAGDENSKKNSMECYRELQPKQSDTANARSDAHMKTGKKNTTGQRAAGFINTFGFNLLKEPIFVIPFLTNMFASIGLFIPFVFITETAITRGIEPRQAAFLISAIGITNTLGRIVMGFLADFKQVSALLLHNIALLSAGVTCILFRFCVTYPALIIFALVFGLCVATWMSLTSIVLCDLLGVQKLANAFGLLCLTRGVAAIIGSPIAGYVYDATSDYNISFLFAGIVFLISGIICSLLHLSFFQRQKFSRTTTR